MFYLSGKRRKELEKRLKEFEERNKKLSKEIKILKKELSRLYRERTKPIVVNTEQKVENIGNPKVIVNIPSHRGISTVSEEELYERPPIWNLLKQGTKFVYSGSESISVTILRKSDDYVILKEETTYITKEEHLFSTRSVSNKNTYVYQVDRDCYYKGYDFTHEEDGIVKNVIRYEESGRLDYWIDPIGLNIGDMIGGLNAVVKGIEKIMNRKALLLSKETTFGGKYRIKWNYYYDARVGLLLRLDDVSMLSETIKELKYTNLKKF